MRRQSPVPQLQGKLFIGGVAGEIAEEGITVRGTRLFLFYNAYRNLYERCRKHYDCEQKRRHTLYNSDRSSSLLRVCTEACKNRRRRRKRVQYDFYNGLSVCFPLKPEVRTLDEDARRPSPETVCLNLQMQTNQLHMIFMYTMQNVLRLYSVCISDTVYSFSVHSCAP